MVHSLDMVDPDDVGSGRLVAEYMEKIGND